MNLANTVERWARETPKACALVFGGKEFTFRDVDRSINRLANGLKKLGVKEGDRVGIMLPNIPDFVYTFFACQKLGVVAVPFNTMYKSREIHHILKDSGASVVVCLTNFVPLINEIREDLPALEHVITTGERTLVFADPDATVVVQAIVGADLFSSVDDAYRRAGRALVEGFAALGVESAEYCHMGAIRVDGRKLAGFTVSAVEDLYIINALCFVDTFDPGDFLNVIWVPPEIKDKIVEPLTSVAECTGTRPSMDAIREIVGKSMAQLGDSLQAEAALSREEKFGYEKQRSLLMPKRRKAGKPGGGLLARLFGKKA